MGLKNFITSAWQTLKLAKKSSRDEFLLYLKLVFLGLFAVGSIGFLILFVSALIKLG
ncbi:MAG: protein translocase SEC61 complex subunit gamma [Nitrososphaerales archaeon]